METKVRVRFNRRAIVRVCGTSNIYNVSKKAHIAFLEENRKENIEKIQAIVKVKAWKVKLLGVIKIITENSEYYNMYKRNGYLTDDNLI